MTTGTTATEGIEGIHVETRDYAATSAFWSALGFRAEFETGHGSGRWRHAAGGIYVFISEQHDRPLSLYPVLRVGDAADFERAVSVEFAQPFTPQHWGVVEAHALDPDGRVLSVQGPLPAGTTAPDADAHHAAKYG